VQTTKDEIIKQVNAFWQQAVDQIEEVKDSWTRSGSRLSEDLARLGKDRDRVLKIVGEQTQRLAEAPLPEFLNRIVVRVNTVIERATNDDDQPAVVAEPVVEAPVAAQAKAAKPAAKKAKKKVSTKAKAKAKSATASKRKPSKKKSATPRKKRTSRSA